MLLHTTQTPQWLNLIEVYLFLIHIIVQHRLENGVDLLYMVIQGA